ncbi:MAG: hypothetical protein JWN10_2830 [Solirubrobacterales bacterium]|nr:hypothetical protein [Solirubrobacterales bacterium]
MMSVVPSELGRFEPVSDELILAAVERAQLHQQREQEGVWMPHVAAQLGFVHGSWTTRRLRPQLDVLLAADALSCSRRGGFVLWGLTSAGRERLVRACRAGEVGELPESPQHREWRKARAGAAERIDGFRAELRSVVAEAGALLDAEATCSDAWFELRERIARVSWHLGSATYCLREWPEPDETKADVDDGSDPGDERFDRDARWHWHMLRRGRRNVGRWDEREPWDSSSS